MQPGEVLDLSTLVLARLAHRASASAKEVTRDLEACGFTLHEPAVIRALGRLGRDGMIVQDIQPLELPRRRDRRFRLTPLGRTRANAYLTALTTAITAPGPSGGSRFVPLGAFGPDAGNPGMPAWGR